MKETEITRLENEGRRLFNDGDYKEAIKYFDEILSRNPGYEYGKGFYDKAICLEELEDFQAAEKNYLKAIEYWPEDHTRLSGYASFLYLHGDTEKAFKAHLDLLELEIKQLGNKQSEKTIKAINELGERIGMSVKAINAEIDKVKQA